MSTVDLGDLEKGDLILVRWTDASNHKATLEGHLGSPEAVCKDWGVYLGVSGVRRKFILVGKDVEEVHNEWGATRIPPDLFDIIIGHDDKKDIITRSITSGRPVHCLLHGSIASAKTLMLEELARLSLLIQFW